MKGERKLLDKVKFLAVTELEEWLTVQAAAREMAAARQEDARERMRQAREVEDFKAALRVVEFYKRRPQGRKTDKRTVAKRERRKAEAREWRDSQRAIQEERRAARKNARRRKPGELIPGCPLWVGIGKKGVEFTFEAVDKANATEWCRRNGWKLEGRKP